MIRLLRDTTIDGICHGKGSLLNLDPPIERGLLANGDADRGTGVFSRDQNGNIVGLAGDGDAGIPLALSYTWNTRPNAFVTPAGTVINILDVGGEAGSLWKATAAGWVPLNGSVKLASRWGSVSSPVATITGSTGGKFSITHGYGSLLIPAAMLIPERTSLRFSALFHRRGSNGGASARIYLGTTGTTSDASAFVLAFNRDAYQVRADVEVGVVSSNSLTSTLWLAPGAVSANAFLTMTTNINTNANMSLSYGISSSNALDAFDLIGYSVVLESQ